MNQDSASRQTSVNQEIFPFLQSTAFLAQVPEQEVEAVIPLLRAQSYPAGSVIIREGDPGDACFIVASGSVDIVTRDLIGQEIALATLGAGNHFGEVALVGEGQRTATVRAVDDVTLYVLQRPEFLRLEESCPSFAQQVRRNVGIQTTEAFLRRSSPFSNLPWESVRGIAGQMKRLWVATEGIILREGDEGDRFYLIRRGRVEILRDGHRVQTLETGDFFGEIALLAKTKRTATVRALVDTELLTLSKAELEAIVQQHESLRYRF